MPHRIYRRNAHLLRALYLRWLLYFSVTTTLTVTALEVTSPQSLVTGRVFDSATFAYYGPQADVNLRAPGVFLDISMQCTPDLESVKGKIVLLGERWPLLSASSECGATQTLGDMYEIMNRAGAVALVFVSHLDLFLVGSLTYHFETWDRCRHCSEPMALVHVSTDALDFMEEWRNQPELEFNLYPTKHRAFRSLFYGFWWTLSFRVFLPAVALITSLEAFLEIYRVYMVGPSSREAEVNRSVAVAVCCIEGPCMLFIGLGSLLGLYGPYAIPVQVANTVFGCLQGAGILSTFLLGLHLAEECRVVKGVGLERRPIFVKYRNFITVMGVLTLGPDAVTVFLAGFCYYLTHRFKSVVVFLMVFYTVLQGIAGWLFISYAITVEQPMLEYLRNVRVLGTLNSQSRRKIGHLVFWLSASAVIMVLASAGMMISSIFMSRGVRDWGVSAWSFVVFYVAIARVLVAAAQVNAVRPVDATTPLSRLLVAVFVRPIEFLLKCDAFTFCKRPVTTVEPRATTSSANSEFHQPAIEIRTMPSKWHHIGGAAPGGSVNL